MASYSIIMTALIDRLKYHSKKGTNRILDGMKFQDYPLEEIDGLKDLPTLRLIAPSVEETFQPGKPTKAGVSLKLALSSNRKKGYPEIFKMLEKVLDAIDTAHDDSGAIDPLLAATLSRPWNTKALDAGADDNSINMDIFLHCVPRNKPLRGRRS